MENNVKSMMHTLTEAISKYQSLIGQNQNINILCERPKDEDIQKEFKSV
jgi:hypothetical protein